MTTNPNYTYLQQNVPKQRITLLQGGTRSGKTFSTIHYTFWLCSEYKGIEIDICRETNVWLKQTVMKDFFDLLRKYGIYSERNHNKSEQTYLLNGNLISYYGLDNAGKVHGKGRDILFLNEAHQVDEEVIKQLFPRTRYRIICDYNPALGLEHWLDYYIEKYQPLITTYKDNPFLTQEQLEDIESRKNDLYWWTVYGCGKRAMREGAVFTNWELVSEDFPNNVQTIFGLDFGFNADPTALVEVGYKDGVIYAKEHVYDKNNLIKGTDSLFTVLKSKAGNKLIVADPHGQQQHIIYDLRKRGLNVVEAKRMSNEHAIGNMLDKKINVLTNSENLKKELSMFCYVDKKSSIFIGDYNHAIDAMKYAFNYLINKPKYK